MVAMINGGIGIWLYFELASPLSYVAAGSLILCAFALVMARRRIPVLRLGALSWTENEFCRHILITGDTGCGKTTLGFHRILVELTKRVPSWGGLVLGVKGEHEFLTELMRYHQRTDHVIKLEVRPSAATDLWQPRLPWQTL